eukprot:CAMPEP_0172401902 /NCGR_PEP_ID=MMETSP1061-20121228/52480_1 /TAXON_ID=37318 /ORGANISM="Pseudo-nitzschia pungens, Strain cf. pungens" /LENGTH=188 /DNA_ID=CAMNT_0013135711 /DNA_START=68 /DNA_END=634 /DNA_ORIENTATION=+
MICIGGVCVPYSAVIPLFLLGIKWIFAKLHTYGLLPNFIAELMNLKQFQQEQKSAPSSCCDSENAAPKRSKTKRLPTESSSASSSVVKRLESDEEFDDLLKKNEKVVVKFTANWCQPCKRIHPFYAKKCEENPEYDFITVDVDDFDEIAGKYSVAMMPTFIIVRGEDVLGTCRGSSEPELDTFLKEHL